MISKNFFVVSGKGVSRTSRLNAFDAALVDAGIAQCNLVPVSSILPEGAKQVKPLALETGAVTFTVLARRDGRGGERICCGIGWAFVEDPKTHKKYGMVAEDSGKGPVERVKKNLGEKLAEMGDARRVDITRVNYRVEKLRIPGKSYGCVISALIYISKKERR